MKKVIIIGSPGAGKSCFARELSKREHIAVYHMDNLFWHADKTHISNQQLREKLEDIMQQESWIIDGNYVSSMDLRIQKADTIFYLDYPEEICFEGIRSRIGRKREDLPWIEEELDEEFLQFVKGFVNDAKPEMEALLNRYKDKKLYRFTSREEADQYLRQKAVNNIAIVSLSAGTIGEDFVKHEVDLGLKRLDAYGLQVKMMPHAQSGISYVKQHPEKRAQDLLQAFQDPEIDMILCAIGGEDTYRLLPYLFDDDQLQKAVRNKIFLGFSDTTMNHLMLHKVGLNTFYGQSFLADICEMDREMLPYTRKYFEELIDTGRIQEIHPSDVWYEERTDWSVNALGTSRIQHQNSGFELLQGKPVFHGQILGGCLESLFDIFDHTRFEDTVQLCNRYQLFPNLQDWKDKILLLETSEEQPSIQHYREMLMALKKTGIFDVLSGIICGKPMNELHFEEYKAIIQEVVDNPDLPIVCNLSIGHATPRCIIPFGIEATVDTSAQVIRFHYADE